MEKKIVSSWFNGKSLPKNYIIPPEKRPGEISYPACEIPVIDLFKANGNDREVVIDQIIKACKNFGFFQVINHGVAKEVMEDAMKVFREFFELPFEEKSHLYSEESNVRCRLYTSSFDYANEEIHYWRDCLKHNCAPLEDCIDSWPRNPPRYREVVAKYSTQVRELGLRLLDLICEGLELESGFFGNGYDENSFVSVNHYPPCPDPRLTLGLPKHCDPNVITLLLQDTIPGLQVCVDNKWLLVKPCPDAFVVNMGYQMQIISNGKLKSAEHRVVTNTQKARTTAAYFILPSKDCIIQPAKALVKMGDPPLYKLFQYAEFIETFKAHSTWEPAKVLKLFENVPCNYIKFNKSWSDGTTLPESYVFPPEERPGKDVVPTSKNVPVIDLGKAEGENRKETIQKIIEASKEFGFFQVINHGVPRKVVDETREIFEEFFELPKEELSKFYSSDISKKCIVYTSNIDFDKEDIHNWRDSVRLLCTPLQECIESWPEKPTRCRKVVGEYVREVGKLGSGLLELISEGLGLEPGYFANELSENHVMAVHHYPPCPDPSLTLGTRRPSDPGLITFVLQGDVPGLQVLKDGKWIGVEAIPHAFVVNIGYQLQIVSNGKLRSVEHRVVTNKDEDRFTVASFIEPIRECIVEPAKALVDAKNPQLYEGVRYADFVQMFRTAYVGKKEDAK